MSAHWGDPPELEELESRLDEVEHGLPGILARPDKAGRYLRRELDALRAESRVQVERWTRVTERADALIAALDDPPPTERPA